MFRFTLTEEIDVRYPLAVAVPDQPTALPSGMAALGLLIIPAWVVKASINPAQQQMDKRTFMVRVSDPDYPDSEPTVKPEGQLLSNSHCGQGPAETGGFCDLDLQTGLISWLESGLGVALVWLWGSSVLRSLCLVYA